MENVQGGDLASCGAGATAGLLAGISSGLGFFGPWALIGSAVVGCIAAQL